MSHSRRSQQRQQHERRLPWHIVIMLLYLCHHFSCVNFPVLLQWCQICTNTQSWVSECQSWHDNLPANFGAVRLCRVMGKRLTTWRYNRHLWLLRSSRLSVFIRIPSLKFLGLPVPKTCLIFADFGHVLSGLVTLELVRNVRRGTEKLFLPLLVFLQLFADELWQTCIRLTTWPYYLWRHREYRWCTSAYSIPVLHSCTEFEVRRSPLRKIRRIFLLSINRPSDLDL